MASLAVPANVPESMAGVGLEGASLRAVGIRAVATAHRFGANGAENQSACDENSGKRSFDKWTHDNLSFSALQSCRNS
jgi:hypothetical protein